MDTAGIKSCCSSVAIVFGDGVLTTHVQAELKDEGMCHQAECESRFVVEEAAAIHRDDDHRICVKEGHSQCISSLAQGKGAHARALVHSHATTTEITERKYMTAATKLLLA